MNQQWRNTLIVVIVLLGIGLGGCSTAIRVNIQSNTDLNLVKGSTPLPVVVRVYLLTDDGAFKNADFYDMWKRDKDILGNTLVLHKEVIVQPGKKEKIEMPFDTKVRFVAGMAVFRNPTQSEWRFIEKIPNNLVANAWHKLVSTGISVRLSENQIRVVD